MAIDPFVQGIIIALSVGLPVGVITGILVKKYAKSKQEKIYEKNRDIIIKTMLHEIYIPFHQMQKIYALFEKQEGFDSSKYFTHEFSDNEYFSILDYMKQIQKILEKFPKFHDCSTFVASNEYLAIKKYIMSARFFYLVDGTAVGKKNLASYDPKTMTDHALFAKDIIEFFEDFGLSSAFIQTWTAILNNEGMLQVGYRKKPVEPGDIVQPYLFDSELLHS